ncbi:hypothetical protein OE810_12570 [Rhodobacteraceae bacterium XHP0102]|nr:hypothetical protein [Rhodobacteraceae bacterium XHP0102]
MTTDTITPYFTRADGSYLFARWGRPIAPVVFGAEDATVATVKGAVEAVVALAGHQIAETDPELGANFMLFFIRDWDEVLATPNMDRLLPDLDQIIARLKSVDANQYRAFRFDAEGGIKAAFVFVRMDAELSNLPADTIALAQVVQTILLWSDQAFLGQSPLAAAADGAARLKPEIAAIIRAGYDPILPVCATDPTHGMRLAARVSVLQKGS